jgi:hypothetical protein
MSPRKTQSQPVKPVKPVKPRKQSWQKAHDDIMRTVKGDGFASLTYGLMCSRLKGVVSLSNNPFVSSATLTAMPGVRAFTFNSARRYRPTPLLYKRSPPPVCHLPSTFFHKTDFSPEQSMYAGNYSLFVNENHDDMNGVAVVIGFSACRSKAGAETRIRHMHLCIAAANVLPQHSFRYAYSGTFAFLPSTRKCVVHPDSGSFNMAKRLLLFLGTIDDVTESHMDEANTRFSLPYVRAAVSASLE